MIADTYDLFNYSIEPIFCGESLSLDLTQTSACCIEANVIVSTEYNIYLWGQVRTASSLPLANAGIQIFSIDTLASPSICHCLLEVMSDVNGVYNCYFTGSDALYYFLVLSTSSSDGCRIFPIPLPNIVLSSNHMLQYYNILLDHLPSCFNITSFTNPLLQLQSFKNYTLPTYT